MGLALSLAFFVIDDRGGSATGREHSKIFITVAQMHSSMTGFHVSWCRDSQQSTFHPKSTGTRSLLLFSCAILFLPQGFAPLHHLHSTELFGMRDLFMASRTLLTFSLISSGLSASVHYLPIRHCPVTNVSTELRARHQYLHQHEPLNDTLWDSSMLLNYRHGQGHGQHRTRQATYCLYTINTFIHIVSDSSSVSPSSANYVTDAMVNAQFEYLATAYTNASICFNLLGIDRSTNNTWATNGDDEGMKTVLRKGTYSTLNIYYQSELQSAPGTPGVPAGSTLLGYCSLPSTGVTSTTPPSVYILDGCNVLSATMPGGSLNGYNLGGTTAHEVGHWNGLLHTFQDNTCAATDFGDYVADTPQEASSTSRLSK